ncbi:hypothetical protein GCM10022227_54230 [Streptomyces sedi]
MTSAKSTQKSSSSYQCMAGNLASQGAGGHVAPACGGTVVRDGGGRGVASRIVPTVNGMHAHHRRDNRTEILYG